MLTYCLNIKFKIAECMAMPGLMVALPCAANFNLIIFNLNVISLISNTTQLDVIAVQSYDAAHSGSPGGSIV